MTKGTTMKNASRSLARPGVEALEDRRLLNGKSLLSLVNLSISPAPALVQSSPSLTHTSASVGEGNGHGSGGLHLGAANGSHSGDAGHGNNKSELASDSMGVGALRKLLGEKEADLGAKPDKSAPGHSDAMPKGGKGKDLPSHEGSPSESNPGFTVSNANAESAGTTVGLFFAPGARPSSQPGTPPSLGIVFSHSPGDGTSPPDVPTASNVLIAPTLLSTEEAEQPISPSLNLKVPGAGDRSWDAFWAEFLPEMPDQPEGVLSAVAVGLQGAGQTQTTSTEPTPDKSTPVC